MPTKVSVSTLNASSIDILNTIRSNAPYEYQNLVPVIEKEADIPKVGEVIMGHPAMSNYFLEALMNRIAFVTVKSLIFNNPYRDFKKGYIEYGETIEEVFINIAKARVFSPEKAPAREMARTLPDVKTAFHMINWRVQYPITIQDEDLRTAFRSANGVTEFIAKLVDTIKNAVEYDEFLLFKYMLIKSVTKGETAIIPLGDNATTNEYAISFKATSNEITFPSTTFNKAGVLVNTPINKQHIFMTAQFNAKYDVETLAGAFNMDKADFVGKLHIIDNFTKFDNDRFSTITAESDMMERVTDEELAKMSDIKAIIVDEDFFQVYDNLAKFTVNYVASGMYWNYFYNIYKTVSTSPYSNIIAFDGSAGTAEPETITAELVDKSISEEATVLTFMIENENAGNISHNYKFNQTEEATTNGIAVHPYGAIIIPPNKTASDWSITNVNTNGIYTIDSSAEEPSKSNIDTTLTVGDTVVFKKM